MSCAQVTLQQCPVKADSAIHTLFSPILDLRQSLAHRTENAYLVYYSEFAPSNLLIISTDDLIFLADLNFHKPHQINYSFGRVPRPQKLQSLQFLSFSVPVEMRESDP